MLNAPFISPKDNNTCPIFLRRFVAQDCARAHLKITGLGLYRAFINGARVGTEALAPGYNDYDAYLRWQSFDVTDLVNSGENQLEVWMGDGWYKGRFGLGDSKKSIWGEDYLLCAELTLLFSNGSEQIIQTDEQWASKPSPITFSAIYDGEIRDDTLLLTQTRDACVMAHKTFNLVAPISPPIRAIKELSPTLLISPKNEQILDFHQNMVGVVRFLNRLPKNGTVRLQFGEILQNGCFYRDNLRSAKAAYSYTSDGNEKMVEPMFTFYGFRYCLVEGMATVDPADFTGVVLSSDLHEWLECQTDSPKINQLMQNTLWGQRGNFLDVPTDCPQRDERLGWTADTQVFVTTACYQMDCKDFYRKYMMDMRIEQTRYFAGDIPMYCPSLKGQAGAGGAVWADAATIIPWSVYCFYRDKDLLQENYPMMRDYAVTLIKNDRAHGKGRIVTWGFTFGDWLAQDGISPQSVKGGTDETLIRTAYYWYSIHLTALAAHVLDKAKDAAKFDRLADKIKQAFINEYITPNGRLAAHTQTAYVLVLRFGLTNNRQAIISGLKAQFQKDRYRMKTGFCGTPLLLPVLFDNGMADDAYRFLYNEDFPGWLYSVNLGATTIWERWNSVLPDGTISGTDMNSLNHYAYGSVCEAIYTRIAGLQSGRNGWEYMTIQPQLNYRMKRMDLAFDSPMGRLRVSWRIKENGNIWLNVLVPVGAKAKVHLPFEENEAIWFKQGGNHEWEYTPCVDLLHPFSADTMLLDLMAHKEAARVLQACLPELYESAKDPDYEFIAQSPRALAPDKALQADALFRAIRV